MWGFGLLIWLFAHVSILRFVREDLKTKVRVSPFAAILQWSTFGPWSTFATCSALSAGSRVT